MTTRSSKPLTFAAMLVRAQRRFEAMGRPFPSARGLMLTPAQPAAPARLHRAGADGRLGLASLGA